MTNCSRDRQDDEVVYVPAEEESDRSLCTQYAENSQPPAAGVHAIMRVIIEDHVAAFLTPALGRHSMLIAGARTGLILTVGRRVHRCCRSAGTRNLAPRPTTRCCHLVNLMANFLQKLWLFPSLSDGGAKFRNPFLRYGRLKRGHLVITKI